MAKVRILSIDGGGMKGIVSAMVLQRVEELIQKYAKNPDVFISDYFELLGGTSTGSIITALLLCPDEKGRPKYQAKDIVDLYRLHGKEIFKKRKAYPINTMFGLCGSKYSNDALKELLHSYFGELYIQDLLKDSMYTAYNTYKREAVFFSTVHSDSSNQKEFLVREVVLASTAAPTYFPPVCIPEKTCLQNCYVDGGIIANNPALCLVVESLKMPHHEAITDTMLLSVASVSNPKYYPYQKAKKWGYIGWVMPLLDILLEGGEESASYQVDKIFHACNMAEKYLRVDYQTTKTVPRMDQVDEDSIKSLEEFGNEIIHVMDGQIKSFVKRLLVFE